MRIMLADDEPIALERLELALAAIPAAEVVARARNGKDALRFMRELRPDIAVLDIAMPVLDGLAAVEALKQGDHVPEIVFVTAYHEHAVRAFEVHAVDYLLKPVDFERFSESLRRAQARLEARAAEARLFELQALIATLRSGSDAEKESRFERELWTRTRTGLQRIPVDRIDHISADGDYVLIHIGDRTHLLKDTIASLQIRLNPRDFLRVHRSTIVQASRIESLQRRGVRDISLVLNNGNRLAVGPSHAQAVMDFLHARKFRLSR